MTFSLSFLRTIYGVGFWLVVVLVLLDLLAYFYYPDTILGEIFIATSERTPLTWISALSFLFIGLACWSVYHHQKQKVWYFLAAVFLFFSLDDAVYLHERISGYFQDSTTFLSEFPTYVWVVLYAPLLVFAVGALTYLLVRGATNSRDKKVIVLAVLVLGSAIFLDLVDGAIQKNSSIVFCLSESCHYGVLHIMRLTEEALEVLALGVLGYYSLKANCTNWKLQE